jgi:hypothetical protein
LGIQDAARKRHLPDKKCSSWDGEVERHDDNVPTTKKQKLNMDLTRRGKSILLSSPKSRKWAPGNQSMPKSLEKPEPMFSDPEDPISWEEKFGNFNFVKFGEGELTRPPRKVRPVKRLEADVRGMLLLTASKDTPHRDVRTGKRAQAIYGFGDASQDGFGDASQDGFGASVEVDGKGVVWHSGTWNLTMREESSNYREFRNLFETIESLVAIGTLAGHELFMLTAILQRKLPFSKARLLAKNCLTRCAASSQN